VTLIIIGVAPITVRDLAMRTAELPAEQFIKAQNLGGLHLAVGIAGCAAPDVAAAYRCLALELGVSMAFLDRRGGYRLNRGLGYRIFLVRRYLAMDVILPYVAWITLLAFAMDWLLRPTSGQGVPMVGDGCLSDPG